MSDSSGIDEAVTGSQEEETFELTDEQKVALKTDRNLAITAGAGTGKTTTLTERYLTILQNRPDVAPSEIVTITFTKDATTDLRRKIRAVIGDQLEGAPPTEYETWRTYKDDLEDAYIHTIHGFCARILREHITDVPVKPEFDTVDETDAAILAREVIQRTVDQRLAEDDTDTQRLARLWSRSQLADILWGLMRQRPESIEWANWWADATQEEYLNYVWEHCHPVLPEVATTIFETPVVQEAFTKLQTLARSDPNVEAGDAGWDRAQHLLDIEAQYAPFEAQTEPIEKQWALNDLANALTKDDGEIDGRDWQYFGTKSRWNNEEQRQQLEAAMGTLLEELEPATIETTNPLIEQNSAPYVLSLARLFEEVVAAYREEKAERNALDYQDLIETVGQLLRTNQTIRSQLRDQFEFVMVDEMQDTDPLQWELIKLLATMDGETFDATELNVFLVGDEKQSIYSFRGADVTTFAQARKDLLGRTDRDTELSHNFRTVTPPLEFLNALFDRVFEPEGETYAPFEARPQQLTDGRIAGSEINGTVEYLLVPDNDTEPLHESGYLESAPQFEDAGEREAYAVAARLTRLFESPPDIYDRKAEETRPAEPRDVAILLRTRNRLKGYERALDQFDIPYVTVSGSGFYDTPEIIALINLIRVLENPNNEIALYGLLRSPLFGYTDEILAEFFATADSPWEALQRTEGTGADLEDAYSLLRKWRSYAATADGPAAENTLPWGRLLSRVIDDTGFLAAIGADERPRQAAVNVNRFREQLRTWEEGGVKTAAQLLTRIERRREIENHTDEASIPEASEGVEIRTVHSSKGLEFPIVVLPDLDQQFNQQCDIDGNGQVYFDALQSTASDSADALVGIKAPDPDDPYKKANTVVRQQVRTAALKRERAEHKRTLYVAMTRARDHLILSGVTETELTDDGSVILEEPNDPEEAKCWLDWVQPHLCPPGRDVLDTLTDTHQVEGTLDGVDYTIRTPQCPNEQWRRLDSKANKPSPRIEVPAPVVDPVSTTMSATEFCKQLADEDGQGQQYDDVFAFEPSEAGRSGVNQTGFETGLEGLSPRTFGTIVHRLCEQRPPRSNWESTIEQLSRVTNETATEKDIQRAIEHATRAIEYVDTVHNSEPIVSTHDELSVTADFDTQTIVGDIDHLIVTPDRYHVIDYKTNHLSKRSQEELVKYYWPQLIAYASALSQNDPSKQIRLSLYFTAAGSAVTRTYDSNTLPERIDNIRLN